MFALCCATSSALPLWAADIPDPELKFVTPDLSAIQEGSSEVYYIYHVQSGMFMSAGSTYGTTLIVATEGLPVTLSYGNDYELSRRETTDAAYYAGEGFRMSMMDAPTNGGFHEAFVSTEDVAYVDHNKQGHILFDIVAQETPQVYWIRVTAGDPTYGTGVAEYATTWMGLQQGEDGTWPTDVDPMVVAGADEAVNAYYDWKFVDADFYEVYAAKKNVMKPQLEAADAAGVDYATELALYNSADATAEALEEAAAALEQRIYEHGLAQATPENPYDLTSAFVQNPNFEATDGWETWRANSNNNFGRTDKTAGTVKTTDGFREGENFVFYERWLPTGTATGDYYVQQALTGLPSGKYRLSARVLTTQTQDMGAQTGLYLFASTATGESSDALELDTWTTDAGVIYAFPHSVEFSVLDETGNVTVGMRSTSDPAHWTGVGYFALEYIGPAEASQMRDVLQETITSVQEQYTNDIESNLHSKVGDEKYQEVLGLAQSALTDETVDNDSILSLIGALNAQMDSLVADVAAYTELGNQINAAYDQQGEWMIQYPEIVSFPLTDELLIELESAMYDGDFNPNDIESATARLDSALKADFASYVTNGTITDLTGMLGTPDFTGDDRSGWTWQNTGSGANNGTPTSTDEVCEIWDGRNGGSGDLYQELIGLPAGSYKITAQAFYAPSSNPDWSGYMAEYPNGDRNVIHGFLFANDEQVELKHIMEHPLTEDQQIANAPTGGACTYVAVTAAGYDGMSIIRNKAAAAAIFDAHPDFYNNEVVCYIEEGDTLRLGIRNATTSVTWQGAWLVFDNFKVEYLGGGNQSDPTLAINQKIEEAQRVLDNVDNYTTDEAKEGLNAAIEEANKVVEGGDITEEMRDEQVAKLDAAITAGNEAITAAEALVAKVEDHAAKISDTSELGYGEYADADAFYELLELVTNTVPMEYREDYAFTSMAQIDEFNEQIDRTYMEMLRSLTDFSTASIDEPVDATCLIYNPSFQETVLNEGGAVVDQQTLEGWTTTGGTATSGLSYEIYNLDSCGASQTLYNVPAGYYRIEYQGFYRAGTSIAAAVARRDSVGGDARNAEVRIASGEVWSQKLPSIFEDMQEFIKYDTGDTFLDDSLFTDDMIYHIVVSNVNGARLTFEDGNYKSGFSFYVPEGVEPVLSVHKTGHIDTDWTIIDNFKLYYLGDGEENRPDDIDVSVDETVADGTATVVSSAWYTINGVRVAEPKQRGIYIRQDKMSDGSVKTSKVMVR